MIKRPFYLSDVFLPFYRFALVFSFMLSIASIFTGIGYGFISYLFNDMSLAVSTYLALMLFFKGVGISAIVSLTSVYAFWKRHQILFENGAQLKNANCKTAGFLAIS